MQRKQLVFLDTEFTSFASPELISIGLAASTGEDFYAEVPFPAASVSPFVREIVMPLLNKDPQAYCAVDRLHARVRDWFAVVRTGSEIVLCFDSLYDENLFKSIFDGYPPAFLCFLNVDGSISELLRHEFHVRNSLPEHHALNDAQAMRYAFREPLHALSSRP